MTSINAIHYRSAPKNFTGILVTPDGTQYWMQNGKRHRDNGPAIVNKKGTTIEYNDFDYLKTSEAYFRNGTLHRLGGPALITLNGIQMYFKNGRLHRKDGPASIEPDVKSWWVEGLLHRLNGPAVEWQNGKKEYFVNGEELTQAQFEVFEFLLRESFYRQPDERITSFLVLAKAQ